MNVVNRSKDMPKIGKKKKTMSLCILAYVQGLPSGRRPLMLLWKSSKNRRFRAILFQVSASGGHAYVVSHETKIYLVRNSVLEYYALSADKYGITTISCCENAALNWMLFLQKRCPFGAPFWHCGVVRPWEFFQFNMCLEPITSIHIRKNNMQ